MAPAASSHASGSKAKGKGGRKSEPSLSGWWCRMVDRDYLTLFNKDDDGRFWEISTWDDASKGTRMWHEPSSLVLVSGTIKKGDDVWKLTDQDKLTPTFDHPARLAVVQNVSDARALRANRRQSTAPPEPDPASVKEPKPSKPKAGPRRSSTNTEDNKPTVSRRRSTRSASVQVKTEADTDTLSLADGQHSHTETSLTGMLGEAGTMVDEPHTMDGVMPELQLEGHASRLLGALTPLVEMSAPQSRQPSPPPTTDPVAAETVMDRHEPFSPSSASWVDPSAEPVQDTNPATSTAVRPPARADTFALALDPDADVTSMTPSAPVPALPSSLPSTTTIDSTLTQPPAPHPEPSNPSPSFAAGPSMTLSESTPSRTPNPFARTPSQATSGPSTPALNLSAAEKGSGDALSAPTNHVGETAYGPSILPGETPAGTPLRPATTMDEHTMDVDEPAIANAPTLPVEAPSAKLPSFKKRNKEAAGTSANASRAVSPRAEPGHEASKGEDGRRVDKGKGKETGLAGHKAKQADGPSISSRASPESIKPSRTSKDEDSSAQGPVDDKAGTRRKPKTEDEPTSGRKRKEPENEPQEHPSSSPLTEQSDQEDDDRVEDEPPTVASGSRVASDERKPAVKKAKNGKLPSSDEDESSAGDESREDSKPITTKRVDIKTEPASTKIPRIKLKAKHPPPRPAMASPATASLPSPASPAGSDKPPAAPSPTSTPASTKLSSSASRSTFRTDVLKKSVHPPGKTDRSEPNSGASTPKVDTSTPGGVKKPGQAASAAAKGKAAPKPSFLLSLVDGGASTASKSSPAASKTSSAEAKKKKEQEAEIAKARAAYFAEVDAECSKPLDIEAQANVMRTFEIWQLQNNVPQDEFIQPLSRGVGWALADKYRARHGHEVEVPMPWPRNGKEAEDWRFRWAEEMEGCWDQEDKVEAWLRDEKRFPGGAWSRR